MGVGSMGLYDWTPDVGGSRLPAQRGRHQPNTDGTTTNTVDV